MPLGASDASDYASLVLKVVYSSGNMGIVRVLYRPFAHFLRGCRKSHNVNIFQLKTFHLVVVLLCGDKNVPLKIGKKLVLSGFLVIQPGDGSAMSDGEKVSQCPVTDRSVIRSVRNDRELQAESDETNPFKNIRVIGDHLFCFIKQPVQFNHLVILERFEARMLALGGEFHIVGIDVIDLVDVGDDLWCRLNTLYGDGVN